MRWGLSDVPESAESCRFEIRGFARSSDPFSFRTNASFFLPPDEAECVQGPPDLLRISSGNRHAVARSMIKRPPKSGEGPSGEGLGCQPRSAGGNSASRSRPKTCRSSPDRRGPPWRYRSPSRACPPARGCSRPMPPRPAEPNAWFISWSSTVEISSSRSIAERTTHWDGTSACPIQRSEKPSTPT